MEKQERLLFFFKICLVAWALFVAVLIFSIKSEMGGII